MSSRGHETIAGRAGKGGGFRLIAGLIGWAVAMALAGCTTTSAIVVATRPASAVVSVSEVPGNVPVGLTRELAGQRFPVRFDTLPGVSYRVRARPIGDDSRMFKELELVVDAQAYARLAPLDTAGKVRRLDLDLARETSSDPLMMTFEFKGVRRKVSGTTVTFDEWDQMRSGMRRSLTARYGSGATPTYVRRFLTALDAAQPTLQKQEGDPTFGGVSTRLYTYTFAVEVEDLADVGALTREIADLGTRSGGAGESIPEFRAINATISYATSFVDSRLTVMIEGIAPAAARVFIYDHDSATPREVKRTTPGELTWKTEFSVAEGRRYVYGYSEEDVGGRRLRKSFRIDIFAGGRQTEIPTSRFEDLRATEP